MENNPATFPLKSAPRASDEAARLQALRHYNILDTLPEAVFDDLTRLAAHICGTPFAFITLVDKDRDWFKSCTGTKLVETPRDDFFCAHSILNTDLFTVEDASNDERFSHFGVVREAPFVRFYAGMPLRTAAGHNLGTLCVLDDCPRALSHDQQQALRILAHQVMSQLELRRHLVELERSLYEQRRIQTALQISETFYSTLVETLPQNILRKDHEGRFTFANERFCKSVGRPIEEILGKTDADIFPKQLAEKFHRDDVRVMTTGEAIDTIEANQTPNGGRIFVHVIKTPLYGPDGAVVGIQGIFWDVTERRKTEEALAYERDLLRALLDQIPDRIYFKDVESRYLRVSRSKARRLGLNDPLEVHGKTDFDFYPKELAQLYFQEEQRIILTGQPLVNKLERLFDNEGHESWVSVTKVPVYNQAGAVTGIIGISRDVSKLKEAESALEVARDAALETARVKSEFLANMSHEIRTPMNAITGMTALLLETELNEEQREFGETIRNSADTLLAIINDILDFSKIEAGKLTLETIDFDLRDLMEGTAEMLAERAQSKGVELACWFDDGVPEHVRGDPGRIRQVLANLLSNGIKFTERGEVILRITREAESDSRVQLRFAVTDTGIGIAQKSLPLIFQAFTQADGSTTRKYGGTGLGLAISRQLVDLMQGKIGVDSTLGEGSTFWFVATLEKQQGPAPAASKTDAHLAGKRVLVVDDNATNRLILHHQIKRWNAQVDSAESGAEALTLLRPAVERGEAYDLAVLDMQMPGMDGLTLAQAIHSDPHLAHTRLLILTSLGHRLDHGTMEKSGISACLVKPIKEVRLFSAIRDALKGPRVSVPATPGGTESGPAALSGLEHVRILLAEDNAVNQKLALRQLKKLGYVAQPVNNGLQVLEALDREPFDIILMDCQMPEMDGYEVSRRIRQREKEQCSRATVYIIALTAHALEGDREHCLATGMNDYLTKPVRIPDLQAALARAVRLIQPLPLTPAPMNSDATPVLDPAIIAGLKELREPGQPDPVADLVNLFLSDSATRLTALQQALEHQNAPALTAAAHSLKGSASNLGARPLAQLFAELEQHGKSAAWSEIQKLFPQVEGLFAEVKEKLLEELQK